MDEGRIYTHVKLFTKESWDVESSVGVEMWKRHEACLVAVAVFQDGDRRHMDHTGVKGRLNAWMHGGCSGPQGFRAPGLI